MLRAGARGMNRNPTDEDRRGAETLWVARDPSRLYRTEEVCDLLEQAAGRGISLDKGSPLEHLTIGELDAMLNGRSRYAV